MTLHAAILDSETDLDGFRRAVRRALVADIAPDRIAFHVGAADLLAGEALPDTDAPVSVPRRFAEIAGRVGLARDPERFSVLYRILWRIRHGEARLMADAADPDVARALRLDASVRRDMHKMHAFLRFRAVSCADGERHVAWFEPAHFILEANAPFFQRRFAAMRWSILTPYRSAHWDGTELRFGPAASRADLPPDDATADAWDVYFRAIFNPARLMPRAMRAEMPMRYWKNLPEAASIRELQAGAGARSAAMLRTGRKGAT